MHAVRSVRVCVMWEIHLVASTNENLKRNDFYVALCTHVKMMFVVLPESISTPGKLKNMPCYVRNLTYDLRNDNALPTDPRGLLSISFFWVKF